MGGIQEIMQKEENMINTTSLYESIVNMIKGIDDKTLSSIEKEGDAVSVKETEKTMTYFWIRIFLKEECGVITPGDLVDVTYQDEKLEVIFSSYGRENTRSSSEIDDEVTEYVHEEDKKCLIFLVDEDKIRKDSEDIPFIRTLFRSSPWFELQVYRREELVFKNRKTGEVYEYVGADL
jgi:hypothetical protein